MFSLELLLLFLKLVYGSVEILQEFPILAHHVFDTFQELFRGWTVGRHSGCKYTPVARPTLLDRRMLSRHAAQT